jgi:hypothetical protein
MGSVKLFNLRCLVDFVAVRMRWPTRGTCLAWEQLVEHQCANYLAFATSFAAMQQAWAYDIAKKLSGSHGSIEIGAISRLKSLHSV